MVRWPISMLWAGVYRFRRFAYRVGIFPSKKFKVPIISVGNLSFGGTNKTPMTLYLSKSFKGKKVAVLMRGYKGKLEKKGSLLTTNQVEDFGDEAILLKNSNPDLEIIVGKKRSQNLERFYNKINSDVILLDDGFQHLKIKRDLDIVLLDSTMKLSKYKSFPLGYLREGFSALYDADIVIYTKCDLVSSVQLSALKFRVSHFLSRDVLEVDAALSPVGIFNQDEERSLDWLNGKKIFAFCGIAQPENFFITLKNLGAIIQKKFLFRDHHFFSDKDLTRMLKECEVQDTILVTTEKDFVRIPKTFKNGKIFFLGVEIKVLKGFEEFENKIHSI